MKTELHIMHWSQYQLLYSIGSASHLNDIIERQQKQSPQTLMGSFPLNPSLVDPEDYANSSL